MRLRADALLARGRAAGVLRTLPAAYAAAGAKTRCYDQTEPGWRNWQTHRT